MKDFLEEFKALSQTYKKSPEFSMLAENSKRMYLHYLKKLLKNGDNDATTDSLLTSQPENAMQIGVAFAVAYWGAKIRSFNGTSAQTMARRVLLNVYGWGRKCGMVKEDFAALIPAPRKTRQDKKPLSKEEAKKLEELLCSSEYPNRFKPYLKAALFSFQTGMRPNEVETLRWEDVGPEYISIRSAKAKEVGVVAREIRRPNGCGGDSAASRGLVFRSVDGCCLNKDTRSAAFRTACRMSGIEEREPYSTRRGTATEMFKAGYDVAHIKGQLGHANIQTTMIYIKPTMREVADQFKGF